MDTLYWQKGSLQVLDQTVLPEKEVYRTCTAWQEVRDAIAVLAVRGAPAIGVAAAYGMVLAGKALVRERPSLTAAEFLQAFHAVGKQLEQARPTAVNLHWAIARLVSMADTLSAQPVSRIVAAIETEACRIQAEDLEINRAMSRFGAEELLKQDTPLTILTHCNAGALATAGIGTALGVIRALHAKGRLLRVYADETRPLLQGARLTVTELMADHIPVTLITDNMAAWVMKTKGVNAVIVGADRIAANGDTANKIGTYGVSILAKEHGIPFYVAAPLSTFDLTLASGADIPIEERNADEVRTVRGTSIALPATAVFNPAFDVTPHTHIQAVFTEKGVIRTPDTAHIDSFFRSHH